MLQGDAPLSGALVLKYYDFIADMPRPMATVSFNGMYIYSYNLK